MNEAVFIPTPNWFLPSVLTTRKDGSVAYGSKNHIVILKVNSETSFDAKVIKSAHSLRVTSVAFSPWNCDETLQNSIASCSDDGFVKLWKIDTLTSFKGHHSHWEQKSNMQEVINIDWSLANPHHIISAASNSTLVVWDVFSNTTVKYCFPRLIFTIVKCCPFNEKIVAVGVKFGLIYIINFNCGIVQSLRGHDTEILSLSWCPVHFNIFRLDKLCEEFLLASASQDKEIFIWRAGSDGKCEKKLLIPKNPISKENCQKYGKKEKNIPFTGIYWHNAYTIYFSNSFGELLYFDIKSYISSKLFEEKSNDYMSSHFILGHKLHSKGLFAFASVPQIGEVTLTENLNVESHLRFKIESNKNNIKKLEKNTSEKMKWFLTKEEESSIMLWTTGQDRKLIGCKFKDSKLHATFNIPTLNGFVYCAVPSPHDPNKVAIGAGDGVIRLWNLTQPSSEVEIYWEKIKDRVMSLAWHPTKDGLLAYGTSKGRIGLIETNSNKPPVLFKPTHQNPIYTLSWGPQYFQESKANGVKSEFDLYSVGNNILTVHNYSQRKTEDSIILTDKLLFHLGKVTDICWKPDFSLAAVGNEDGIIYVIEPLEFKIIHILHAYKKLIQSIAWHPLSTSVDCGLSPYHTYFTAGSTDNSNIIQVYNAKSQENKLEMELVASLKGHKGYIQSVSWSPYVGGRLLSSSADYSVIIWDVISQNALFYFTSSDMPLFSLANPIDSDLVFTGYVNSILLLWKVSTQSTNPLPLPSKTKKQKKNKIAQMDLAKISNENSQNKKMKSDEINGNENENVNIEIAEERNLGKNIKELKMFSNAWKNNESNDEFKSCYSLLKEEKNDVKLPFLLPFFGSEDEYKSLISSEEEIHKKSNNWNEYYELAVWNGKIKNVIEEKMKSGRLNDFLVSLAPLISPRLWQEACISYSKTLTEKKQFRKAATYLIICHKIYDAINLLTSENLYLEALCIAKSRLPESDPVNSLIVRQYAQWLFKNGSYLKAAECYIFLEEYLEVAKICGLKSKPEYLSLAALASKKCGEEELEFSEATAALLKCFEINNFELAERICSDHSNLKHLLLLYKMYFTIQELDKNSNLILEKDILSYIKESVKISEIKLSFPLQQLYQKCNFYKNKNEMYIAVAQELSLAVLTNSTSDILVHLIRALSTSYRFIQSSENEIHPLFKLCCWLSPGLSLGNISKDSYFNLEELEYLPKIRSLREFLCAAIIKNLIVNLNEETFQKYIFTLEKLKDNILHEESYQYFKNLIEVEICEKRLLATQNGLVKKQFSIANISHKKNESSDPKVCDMEKNGKMEQEIYESKENLQNFENKFDDLQNDLLEKELNHTEEGIKQLTIDNDEFTDSTLITSSCEDFKENELKEQIYRDKELLSRLKTEIKDFETLRISSPNPVPIYFLAKQLFEKFVELEPANFLLEYIQSMWQKLQN